MANGQKYIYPMMIELNSTIKDTCYYLSLPREIKNKWIQLERKSKAAYNPMFNLPTITLKEMLCTFLDGIVDMNPVSEQSDDRRWLVSFADIHVKVVLNCFKIWIDEFYIQGNLADYKRKKGANNEEVRQLASELKELLTVDAFGQVNREQVVLFDKGKAKGHISYQLYPLRLVTALVGKPITFKGIDTKLIYSGRNELITDTKDFHHKDDYFSYVIQLSVQTLPPDNKAYLLINLSIRRWISRNEKGGYVYLPNNKKCYVRVTGDRMRVIQTEYNKEIKENAWKSVDYRCFIESQPFYELPKFTEVLNEPLVHNQGIVGDVLIPYEEGLQGIYTSVKSGVSFIDRKTAFDFIKEKIESMDHVSSNVQALQVKKIAHNKRKSFNGIEPDESNSQIFLSQLDKAVNGEKVTIEIYAEASLRVSILEQLNIYFRDDTKHKIKCFESDFHKALEKTELSKKENLPGFERRVDEITQKLHHVTAPTLSIVAIHNKDFYKRLDNKISVDPKKAIRCGFAKTGRLTQFITLEEFNNEIQKISDKYEKYEIEKRTAQEKGEKVQPLKKTDQLNLVVNGAILDGFRQLGVVFDYSINKYLKGKKVVGVHICNFKKTNYGVIPPFPIIISYDVDRSQIMVYSDLIDKVEVPYWKGILQLSRIAADKDVTSIRKNLSSTSTYRRLDRIVNSDSTDTVILFDADGTSRKLIKGITNTKIETAEKNEMGYIQKLLINDEHFINFMESPNNLAVVRIRHNSEVGSYFPMDHEIKETQFKQVSGLFKYGSVYYSIDGRPAHEGKGYGKLTSKSNSPASFSHRNMIELYPIYISGDKETHPTNEIIAIGIVDILRDASIQYTAQKTVLPLPLHLAEKMEEYI